MNLITLAPKTSTSPFSASVGRRYFATVAASMPLDTTSTTGSVRIGTTDAKEMSSLEESSEEGVSGSSGRLVNDGGGGSSPNRHVLGSISYLRMMISFVCNVCETTNKKHFSKQSYLKGIVLIRCDGCKKFHLIADNLSWLGPQTNIEEIMAAKGERVIRFTVPEQDQESKRKEPIYLDAEVAEDDNVITVTPK
jgi:hypothetical protein